MDKTPELDTEVQDLTWALIDEQATDSEVGRLAKLLEKSGGARQMYVRCMADEQRVPVLPVGQQESRLPRVLPQRSRPKTAGLPGTFEAAALPPRRPTSPCVAPRGLAQGHRAIAGPDKRRANRETAECGKPGVR